MKLKDALEQGVFAHTEKKPNTKKSLQHATAIIETYSLQIRLKLSNRERLALQYLLAHAWLTRSHRDTKGVVINAALQVANKNLKQKWAMASVANRRNRRLEAEESLRDALRTYQDAASEASLLRFDSLQNFSADFMNVYVHSDFINRRDALESVVARYAGT